MAADPPLPVDYRKIPEQVNICREVLDRQIENGSGNRTAFVWDGGSITYDEVAARVERLARGFGANGIGRGVPVLVRMPNCLELALSFLALTRLGAIPVLQKSLVLADS